jgi:hypothetical protein
MRSRKISIPCPRYEKKRSDILNSKINKKCDRKKLVFLGPDMRNNCRTYRTPKEFGMSDSYFSYLGQGILTFSIAFLVYFRVQYIRPFFLIFGTRDTNFSLSHFLFILEPNSKKTKQIRSRKGSIPCPQI